MGALSISCTYKYGQVVLQKSLTNRHSRHHNEFIMAEDDLCPLQTIVSASATMENPRDTTVGYTCVDCRRFLRQSLLAKWSMRQACLAGCPVPIQLHLLTPWLIALQLIKYRQIAPIRGWTIKVYTPGTSITSYLSSVISRQLLVSARSLPNA